MSLRIALVANTDWYLYNYRLSLARAIRQSGAEPILVSPPGSYVERILKEGFPWLPVAIDRRSVDPWVETLTLYRFVALYRKGKFDLVHHFTHKPMIYGSLAARALGGMGVVDSVTGLGYLFTHRNLIAGALRAAVRPAIRVGLAPARVRVIFQNAGDQGVFLRDSLVDREKTTVIAGSGIDLDRFHPGVEPEEPLVVLMPARMLWDKGVGDLVEAAHILRASGLAFRLVLAGPVDPGNPTSIPSGHLKRWREQESVEWLGHQDDMVSILRAAHIVALPSRGGEGLPRALVEAAASGKPIVTTTVDGCRDVVQNGENGLLVPPHDPLALAVALRSLLLDSELRQRMGRHGRQVAVDRFSDATVNEQTLSVYRQLIPLPVGRKGTEDEPARP